MAGAYLGNLVANIVANTAPFESGLKRANQSLDRFGARNQKSQAALGGLGKKMIAAAAAALSFGAVTRRLVTAMHELNSLSREAESLNMNAQALRNIQYAAQQAGMSATALNTALRRMNLSVTQAAHGTGEAKEEILQLGLNARKLAAMGAEQQLTAITNAFASIESPAEKARLATALFGESGREMIQVLEPGNAALKEQAENMEMLAGKVSALDLENIKKMKNAWQDVKVVLGGIWEQFLISAEPVLTLIAKIIKMSVWGLSVLAKYNPFFVLFNLHRERQNKLAKERKRLNKELLPSLKEEKKNTEAIAKARKEQLAAAEKLKREGDAVRRQFMTPQEKFADRMADLLRLQSAGAIGWETYRRAVSGAVNELREATKGTKQLKQAQKKSVASVQRGTAAAFTTENDTRRAMQGMKEAQEKQLQEQKKTNKILEQHLPAAWRNRTDLKVVNL